MTGPIEQSNGAITCRELVQLVSEYLDGSLMPRDRARFEDHIDMCNGCRHHLDQVRMTVQAVGTLREDHLSAPARDRLLSAFQTWKRSS